MIKMTKVYLWAHKEDSELHHIFIQDQSHHNDPLLTENKPVYHIYPIPMRGNGKAFTCVQVREACHKEQTRYHKKQDNNLHLAFKKKLISSMKSNGRAFKRPQFHFIAHKIWWLNYQAFPENTVLKFSHE